MREHGYTLVLCSSDEDAEIERASVDSLARRRVEGLLLMSVADDHAYLSTRPMLDVPIVALDRPINDLPIDTVVVENRAGAYEATKHLIWHGHRRIACVGVNTHNHASVERYEGYLTAILARWNSRRSRCTGIPRRLRSTCASSASCLSQTTADRNLFDQQHCHREPAPCVRERRCACAGRCGDYRIR